MRRLLCTNCFDYAFNFFTSFGLLQTQREHLNAIHMVGTALRPKGVFVLDYLNAPHIDKPTSLPKRDQEPSATPPIPSPDGATANISIKGS
jgi:hypothetical protein